MWTETCQYYAFFLGYASKETDPELYEVMFERALVDADGNMTVERMSPSNVFIGLYLRFDYLSSIGEHQKVVDGLVSTFSYQIEKTRTLWEYLDPNKSLCHGFASIVCVWLDRCVRSRA